MGWTLCSDDASVATVAAEKAILCVLFEEFSEPDEIGINTCLILQNTLNVTVTALAVQNKRDYPTQVKWSVETVVPNYCDPTFALHSGRKDTLFSWRLIHFFTSETVLWSIWPYCYFLWVLSLSLLITVVVLWYCNIYYYIIRGV